MVKCSNCGAEVQNGTSFCTECGTKCVNSVKEKKVCIQCGSEIAENANFCENCGQRTQETDGNVPSPQNNDMTVNTRESNLTSSTKLNIKNLSIDNLKIPIKNKWESLDLFGKLATTILSLIVALFLVAAILGNGVGAFFAFVQLILIVFYVLIHKKIILLDTKKYG